MPMISNPNIKVAAGPNLLRGDKLCSRCKQMRNYNDYIKSKSIICGDGYSPICNFCINEILENDENWATANNLCRSLDIPFVPNELQRLRDMNSKNFFIAYSNLFQEQKFADIHWEDYYEEYKKLQENGLLRAELPLMRDEYYEELRQQWGSNYDEEQLLYLNNLLTGLMATQNVNGALNMDQAKKLCKISLSIDERIMADMDFDKLIASYEKLTKIADFTPKNAKNDSGFSSMGEIVAWEEKRGWLNKWYDGANKDIVDEVIHSMQTFVQRLYTNEPGIGDEVNERIQQLKIANEAVKTEAELEQKRFEENPLLDIEEVDFEKRENETYEELILDEVFDSDTVGV